MIPSPWTGTKLAAFATVALMCFVAGMGTHKMLTDPKIERMQREWAQNVTAAVAATQQAEHAAREKETELHSKRDAAQKGLEDERRETTRLALELATRGMPRISPVDAGLRGALETARLAGQAASVAAASADARARAYEAALSDGDRTVERMGRSLGECRELAADSARSSDERSAEVRALMAAWPR